MTNVFGPDPVIGPSIVVKPDLGLGRADALLHDASIGKPSTVTPSSAILGTVKTGTVTIRHALDIIRTP